MKVIFLTFILAATAAAQAVAEKTDRELLLEIRQMLAARQTIDNRAAVILKRMDVEINAIELLEPAVEAAQDGVDKAEINRDAMASAKLNHYNNGPPPADEDGDAAAKRLVWEQEVAELRDSVAIEAVKVAKAEAKLERLQKRLDAARANLSRLEAELTKL